jgi:hypothetical protein
MEAATPVVAPQTASAISSIANTGASSDDILLATNALGAALADPAAAGLITLEVIAAESLAGTELDTICPGFAELVGETVATVVGGAITDPLESLSLMPPDAIAAAYQAASDAFEGWMRGALGPMYDMTVGMMNSLGVLDEFGTTIHMPNLGLLGDCMENMCGGGGAAGITYGIQEQFQGDMNITEEGYVNLEDAAPEAQRSAIEALGSIAQDLKNEAMPSPLPTPDVALLDVGSFQKKV